MSNSIVERILRESDTPTMFDVLAERLNPSDLQSLLLEVYRRRAAQQTPSGLLSQYARNRFARPSATSPRVLAELDRIAFEYAAPLFQPVELAPVCPLGSTSVITPVDQNSAVATIRNTELVSDSTHVLALECALRRQALLRTPARRHERVRLCASHRLLRAQNYDRPGALAHFRLFGLCTAGRDEGSYRFECVALAEQLGFYLRLLSTLAGDGYAIGGARVGITDLTGGTHLERLRAGVVEPLSAQFPSVAFSFDPDRQQGRDYYASVCFFIYLRDQAGAEHALADGGFTTWTQQLLGNHKERLLISGIGTERLYNLFAKE